MDNLIKQLTKTLGYTFANPSLLSQALTHRSFLNECPGEEQQHNERLEFLGDAVVDLSVGHQLMERLPDIREGELSKLRAMVVSEVGLATVAEHLDLGSYLRLGRGEARSGGRGKASILADAFEAVIGAVFLDGGYEAADRTIRHVLEPLIEDAIRGGLDRDHKTRLQELSQREWQIMPQYSVVDERGPDHAKVFTVVVVIADKEVARAEGSSKKLAEQRAAKQALRLFDTSQNNDANRINQDLTD